MRKLLALSALLVLIDQGTKLAVKGFNLFGVRHEGMYLGESISVIGDFLRFTFVENPGMAFGLDFGVPILLGLFSIGAAIFLVHLLRKSRNGKIGGFHVALAMILGGAVGNLIDRVFYGVFYGYASLFKGKVVDFVDVDIPDISLFGRTWDRFYIFNVADAAVSVGIVLLLIFYPKHQQRQAEEEARRKEEEARRMGNSDPVVYTQVGPDTGASSTPLPDHHKGTTTTTDSAHSNHTTPPKFNSDSTSSSYSKGMDSTDSHGWSDSGYDGGGGDGGGDGD